MDNVIDYEAGLELMTEQLRSECLRLHGELQVAQRRLLGEPVVDLDPVPTVVVKAGLEAEIARNRREFSAICERDTSEPWLEGRCE